VGSEVRILPPAFIVFIEYEYDGFELRYDWMQDYSRSKPAGGLLIKGK
jgi:hypothetical protein